MISLNLKDDILYIYYAVFNYQERSKIIKSK